MDRQLLSVDRGQHSLMRIEPVRRPGCHEGTAVGDVRFLDQAADVFHHLLRRVGETLFAQHFPELEETLGNALRESWLAILKDLVALRLHPGDEAVILVAQVVDRIDAVGQARLHRPQPIGEVAPRPVLWRYLDPGVLKHRFVVHDGEIEHAGWDHIELTVVTAARIDRCRRDPAYVENAALDQIVKRPQDSGC